jgi:hypothetical protein
MKVSKILGALLPTIDEYKPILKTLRTKYNLPEISPDDEPIKEIYLDDQIIPLEDFHQEIYDLVSKNSGFLFSNPNVESLYKQGKLLLGKPLVLKGYEKLLPKKTKKAISDIYDLSQKIMELVVNIIDQQFKAIADIIYIYLLTGETQEAPQDWISQVGSGEIDGEPVIFAFASQITDPDIMVQQFREQYKKTFGIYKPKLTDTMVSTAHYLQLKRLGKPWDYIVEEFIRLNKFSLPRDRSSPKYFEDWRRYEQTLKKRMQRSQIVLDVLGRDKK